MLDVADRHPAGVEADDDLVEAAEAASTLGNQPRREGPVTVSWRGQLDLTDLRRDRLRGEAVARVREQRRLRGALLIAEMIGQLRVQATLERRLDQLRDHPTRAGHLQLARIDHANSSSNAPDAISASTASEPDPPGSSVSLIRSILNPLSRTSTYTEHLTRPIPCEPPNHHQEQVNDHPGQPPPHHPNTKINPTHPTEEPNPPTRNQPREHNSNPSPTDELSRDTLLSSASGTQVLSSGSSSGVVHQVLNGCVLRPARRGRSGARRRMRC